MTNIYLEKIAEQEDRERMVRAGKTLGYAGAGALAGHVLGRAATNKKREYLAAQMSTDMTDIAQKMLVNKEEALQDVGAVARKYTPMFKRLNRIPLATAATGAIGAAGLGHYLNRNKKEG